MSAASASSGRVCRAVASNCSSTVVLILTRAMPCLCHICGTPRGWPSAGRIDEMTPENDLGELLFAAIRSGDLTALGEILAEHPGLGSAPLGGRYSTRTPLHVAADWPGYFPNGPQVVRLLVEAGADPNARSPGDEPPLHWAASSDDSDVADALIEGGADVNAPDGSIGTPLANA